MKWFNTLSHNRWLEQETDRIFDFGKNSVVPTGFGWLGNKGQIKDVVYYYYAVRLRASISSTMRTYIFSFRL